MEIYGKSLPPQWVLFIKPYADVGEYAGNKCAGKKISEVKSSTD